MSPELRDALESAATVDHDKSVSGARRAVPRRGHAVNTIRAIVLAVAQELPSEMTMAELCDELVNANNQVDR